MGAEPKFATISHLLLTKDETVYRLTARRLRRADWIFNERVTVSELK